MAEVIASAVALPDPEDLVESPANNGLKRRQSEISGDDDSSSKRQRTSPGKTPPRSKSKEADTKRGGEEVISSVARARSITPVEPKNKSEESAPDNRVERRKSAAVKAPDEKQRSKRLFGALLGNLNRPSDRQSKRRAEIEQRKKAELQKQDDERLEDRQRRLERLAIQRKNEQLQVDERNMHIRHKNLLSNANFLQTRTEPRLHYRPWDLLPDEEDLIERQLKEAQAQVDQELDEWAEEKRRRSGLTDEPPDEIPPDTTTHEGASKSIEPLKGDTSKDEEMTVDSTNVQSEPEVTVESDGSAEVPNSVPTSPQPANSAVDEDEIHNTDQPEDGERVQPEKQRGDVDEEDNKDAEATEVEQPDINASSDTKVAIDGEGDAKDDKDELDDDGDHVVEGDEDDVIY